MNKSLIKKKNEDEFELHFPKKNYFVRETKIIINFLTMKSASETGVQETSKYVREEVGRARDEIGRP